MKLNPVICQIILIENRESPTDEDRHKWIFYQQGGGWCYDTLTCLERVTTSHSLTSSNGWKDSLELEGIFEMVKLEKIPSHFQ